MRVGGGGFSVSFCDIVKKFSAPLCIWKSKQDKESEVVDG